MDEEKFLWLLDGSSSEYTKLSAVELQKLWKQFLLFTDWRSKTIDDNNYYHCLDGLIFLDWRVEIIILFHIRKSNMSKGFVDVDLMIDWYLNFYTSAVKEMSMPLSMEAKYGFRWKIQTILWGWHNNHKDIMSVICWAWHVVWW